MSVQAISLRNELSSNELAVTLKNSLYPDASVQAIQMVLSYCKALKLDPMMKPVHIVKMGDKEVLMPGIGLYRTQALRSGAYAGLSEPEFGPTITEEFKKPIVKWTKIQKKDGSFYNKKEVTGHENINVFYPEWCKITVRKLVQNKIVEITAIEYWLENYATCSKDSNFPNEMWLKRPRGQLAKCAEAQALRKMFPEFVPQQPTYEEMEGKTFDHIEADIIDDLVDASELSKPLSAVDSVKQKLKIKVNVKPAAEMIGQIAKGDTESPAGEPQNKSTPLQPNVKEEVKTHLKFLVGHCQVKQARVNSWFKRAGIPENAWSDFPQEQAVLLIEKLEADNVNAKQAWVDFLKARGTL